MNDMENLTPEPENCEQFSNDITYGINFITKGLLYATRRVVKDDEKFTIPQQYRFGECEIRNERHYRFSPGVTYAISDYRILEYSEQSVKIYNFHENPRWSGRNDLLENPCFTAVCVQTWNLERTECLSESWGYADRFGKIVIPAQYDKATDLSCWNIGAVKQHGKWYFIYALTGERIDGREYDDVAICPETGYFSYSAKELGDGRGVIDPLGNMITRPIYGTMPHPMFDGTFKTFVKKNDKPIFINRQERVLDMDTKTASATYEEAQYWNPDFHRSEEDLFKCDIPCIIVGRDGKYGLMAHSGRQITKLEYDNIFEYDIIPDEKPGMVFRVTRDDKWGLIDDAGKEVLATVYGCIMSGDSEHIRIEQNEKLGCADLQGTITVPPVYERLVMSGEGVAAGLIDGKWQIVGTDGKMITPPCYDTCQCLGEGFFLVTVGEERYTVDRLGNRLPFVIDNLDESIWNDENLMDWGKEFEQNYLPAYRLARKGIIRRDGTSVIPCIYDTLYPLRPGRGELIVATLHGSSGVLDLSGEIVIPFEYDRIEQMPPHATTITVCREDRWGELHPDGSIAYPLEYEGIVVPSTF